MRITAILAFLAVVLVGPASIAAQQPANGLPPKANLFGNRLAPPGKPASPPRFLFPTPTFPDARLARKPTVVCGLTLIPADPNVDPAFRHEVPGDDTRFAIRSVDPQLCRRP